MLGCTVEGGIFGLRVLWVESAIVVQFLFNCCAILVRGLWGSRALLGRGALRVRLLCGFLSGGLFWD